MFELKFQLNYMTEEAQSAPGSFRSGMMTKVRGNRFHLDKLKKEIVSNKQPIKQLDMILYGTHL